MGQRNAKVAMFSSFTICLCTCLCVCLSVYLSTCIYICLSLAPLPATGSVLQKEQRYGASVETSLRSTESQSRRVGDGRMRRRHSARYYRVRPVPVTALACNKLRCG